MELETILKTLGVVILIALILAAVVLAVALRKLKRIRLPPNADFFTTVRAVPLSLVVGLDSFEALLPFTGPIPTLTIAWFAARWLNLGQPYDPNVIEAERIGPGRYAARPGGR